MASVTAPSTTASPTAPSVQKVIETVELLEWILLELPLEQLFLIQRTNKAFRDTIAGSVKLQRKMFLAPAADTDTDGELEINPILYVSAFLPTKARKLPAHGEPDISPLPSKIYDFSSQKQITAFPPKLTDDQKRVSRAYRLRRVPEHLKTPAIFKSELQYIPEKHNVMPSWCGMWVSQPSQTPVEVSLPSWRSDLDFNEKGVKLGRLYEVLDHRYRQAEEDDSNEVRSDAYNSDDPESDDEEFNDDDDEWWWEWP